MASLSNLGESSMEGKRLRLIETNNKQLLPGLLVDSADYHPEKELFPEGNARGK